MPTGDRSNRRLRVATYNVHRCIGMDGRLAPERVSAVIGEIEPDVIGLQEVDTGFHDGGPDQLAHLARATGLGAWSGPTLRNETGDYGSALLTRHPVLDIRRHDLSVADREPRGALEARISVNGFPLRICVTHLGLRRRERRAQVARLLHILHGEPDDPLVLLADLNEWAARGSVLRPLRRALGPAPAVRSFPSRLPLFPLDRVWVRPASWLGAVRPHRSALARVASDHLPIVAEIHAREGGEPAPTIC